MKFSLVLVTLLVTSMSFIGCGDSDTNSSDSSSSAGSANTSNGGSSTGSANTSNGGSSTGSANTSSGGSSTGSANTSSGGSSTGSANTSNSGNSTGSANVQNSQFSISPVSTTVVCDPEVINMNGFSYDVKYLANGDILVECVDSGAGFTYAEYKLKNGVNSLTVTQLIKQEEYVGVVNGINFTSLDTYNYQAGTIHHKVSSSIENYDCVETFASPLPTTITNDSEVIENLLDWSGGDRADTIRTTCPDSYYDDEDNNDENFRGNFGGMTNYTVTDNNGNKHYITEISSMSAN